MAHSNVGNAKSSSQMEAIIDGVLNPAWLQHVSSKDSLFNKIRAYYLAGTKVKPAVQCCASSCVMPSRLPGTINDKTIKEEYNPMIFCYFCNRTFHLGCYNMDAALLKEEKVPWRCIECSIDLRNPFAVKFYADTSYNLSMKQRRGLFLREAVTSQDEESDFATDGEFDTADKESFRRRAFQLAFGSSEVDLTVDISSLGGSDEVERLQHSIMRAKADELKALERSKKVLTELEAEQRKTKDFAAKLESLQKQMDLVMQSQSSQAFGPNVNVPSIHVSTAPTATYNHNNGTGILSQFYTSGSNIAYNEQNSWQYRPEPVNLQIPHHSTGINPPQASSNSNQDVTALLTRLTTAQERSEERHLLEMRRKAVPKITEFNGDPAKWLVFQQDINRYKVNCKFDNETIKLYLRGALKGEAFELVRDIFDAQPLDVIMDILKSAYGDEMMLIRKRSEELKQVKIDSHLYRSEVVKLLSAIQAYFSACNYAGVGYINANELGEAVFIQFNPEDRQRCKEFYMHANPNARTIVICIQTIYDYLMSRMPLLDDVIAKGKDKSQTSKKPFQVHAVASSSKGSSSVEKDGYKFELRDKNTAIYMGYDMAKVNNFSKKCEICSRSDHFTFQCPQYRAMDEIERLKIVDNKNLCRSCVITNAHIARNCDVKAGCGLRLNKLSRCTQKHHISLHNAAASSQSPIKFKQKRRTNTNSNAAAAGDKIQTEMAKLIATKSSAVAFHALEPDEVKKIYKVSPFVVNHNTDPGRLRSVKVFKVKLIGPNGFVTALVVGDSGSEVTLVRDDLREALGIEGDPEVLDLRWSDSSSKSSNAVRIELTLQGVSAGCERHVLKDCFAVSYLSLPPRSLNMTKLRRQFTYLAEAEFDSYFNEEPVMLIGSPHAYLMEGNGKLLEGGAGGPVALTTKLGWTVYGGSSPQHLMVANIQSATLQEEDSSKDEQVEACPRQKVTNEQLSEMLDRFHSVESLGIKAKETRLTEDERKAVEIIEEEMNLADDGIVEVPLIWNRVDKVIPMLPNNYHMVLKRQIAHETKLRKNPAQLKAFNDNVKELLELGFLRYATADDMNTKWQNIWYLPMSLVVNTNKVPPKMRNVYDASANYQAVSLNSKLLKGPDLLVNILQPLLKMRMGKYAFTADVSKMFHMMRLRQRDQQCQRILWRENHDEPMKTLILAVMSFGPTCSPFTSQYVKNWNADRWMEIYPDAANTLKNYTYMDDVLTSESTLDKAVEVANQCIEICDSIGWKLVSFQSNSVELLQSLPPSTVKKDVIPLLESESDSLVTKVLGCSWNTKSDCFEFHLDKNLFVQLVNEFDHKPTKRDQASTIARIYDNLGFISNYTILGKILLQRSWQLKLDWDQVIPDEEAKLWKQWLQEINNIAKLKINRRYTTLDSIKDADQLELHTFCDAGGEAFGTVSYLVVKKGGLIESNITMAKAKVTPLRLKSKTTICEMPRLELLAALIAARLANTITSIYHELKLARFFWSDSEVVLRWILNPNHRLVKYAIAPVEEILELTKREEWRYVPTKLNPADLCTKFRKFDFEIASTIWINGPDFLKQPPENWPKMPEKLLNDDNLMANNIYLATLNYSTHKLPTIDNMIASDDCIDRFSPGIKANWMKLVRATARALKIFMDGFIPLVRMKQLGNLELLKKVRTLMDSYQTLTPCDLERAEHFIFRKIQREEFPEEYERLRNGLTVKKKEYQQLNIFMDQEGLIRINSRVNLNSANYPQQFAPLLPRKSAIVSTLLMHYHQKYKHIAVEAQIAEIRTKCWIPQLRTAMRSIKSKCNSCNLRNAKPYGPPMAPLPDFRTNPEARPFEVTGIDVLGPIIINRSKKIYILIFVCALTRYVHLHVLESLESLRVLEAITVFWTAYGPVRKFVSDNGTNFKGAAKILREDYLNSKMFLMDHASILQPKLSELYCIEWEFISAYAPWFGGLYERLIKEVKRALYDTLQDRKIHKIELNIAVHETAHRLNCRPLVENSIDAADEEILTPHHLAKNRSGWPLLAGLHKNKYVQVDDRSLYRRGRLLADEIMRKFVAYHLPSLTKRSKWHDDNEPIMIDDLVLMIKPNLTRRQWQRGKVIELHKGRDGNVRSADIILANGKIKKNRAVRNLAKIKLAQHPAEPVAGCSKSFNINCIHVADRMPKINYECSIQHISNAVEHVNYNFYFFFSFKQVYKSLIRDIMAQVPNQHPRIEYPRDDFYRVIQLENVSARTHLSLVVEALLNDIYSIIGIFRPTDYLDGIQDTLVYLYLVNKLDFERLLEIGTFFVNGQLVTVSDPHLIAGTSEFTVDVRIGGGDDIRGAPMPIGIFRLRILPASTTFYLLDLLRLFEANTRVTGLRLAYDEHSKKTRSFGLLTVLTRRELVNMVKREFRLYGERIVTDFTYNTQVLLPENLSHLFDDRRRCELTQLVRRENRLCFNICDLTISLPPKPLEVPTVERQPMEALEPQTVESIQMDNDNVSAYTPPLPPPASSGIKKKVRRGKDENPGPSKGQKSPKKKRQRLDVDVISSSMSGLSLGDDYQLGDDGKINRGL